MAFLVILRPKGTDSQVLGLSYRFSRGGGI